jgi:hypothetical protein
MFDPAADAAVGLIDLWAARLKSRPFKAAARLFFRSL